MPPEINTTHQVGQKKVKNFWKNTNYKKNEMIYHMKHKTGYESEMIYHMKHKTGYESEMSPAANC